MPIPLGILAQSRQAVAASDFVLLETQVLGTAAASVTFSGLSTYSSTYKHLQIRLVARTTGNNGLTGNFLNMQFNGDTGNNYSMHQLQGNGSGTPNSAYFPDTSIYLQRITSGGNVSGDFGVIVTDILDAFATTKNKTTRSLGGIAERTINLTSGSWRNTNALTSVLIKPNTDNFAADSRFSLYGIRG